MTIIVAMNQTAKVAFHVSFSLSDEVNIQVVFAKLTKIIVAPIIAKAMPRILASSRYDEHHRHEPNPKKQRRGDNRHGNAAHVTSLP